MSSPRQRIRLQAVIGVVLLAGLAIPAVVHSMAAIRSLRNLPAEWLPETSPAKIDFNRFAERFEQADVVMASWPGAKISPAGRAESSLEKVATLLEPLSRPANQEGADADRPEWVRQFYAKARDLADGGPPVAWVLSGEQMYRTLSDPPLDLPMPVAKRRLAGTMVGPDGWQSCVFISLSEHIVFGHRDLLPLLRDAIARVADVPPDAIALVGGPVEGAAVDAESIRSIDYYAVPSALFAALLCFLCLRSIPLTAAIAAVAIVGQGMVLALVYYSGEPMSAVLIVLPALVFVMTISAGIHLSNYYLDILREQPDFDRYAAAMLAMRHGAAPCLIAAGTTVAGLASLMLVRLQPVRLFGFVASVGVLLTLGLLLLILPAAMVASRPSVKSQRRPIAGRFPQIFAWMERWRWVVIGGFLIIGVAGAWGLRNLSTTVSVPGMFSPESDLRKQYVWFEENIGPTATADLLITYPIDDRVDPLDRLREVTRVHAALMKLPSVEGALSAATFTPRPPRSGGLGAIATRGIVRNQILDTESPLHELGYIDLHNDQQTWRVTVRLYQAENADFEERMVAILSAANDAIGKAKPDAARPEVTLTGVVALVQRSQQILLNDLGSSFLTALVMILLIMIVTLRNFWGGCLAMLPNLFPTLILFGAMGWLGQPLDIGSIMTASVALGIAIDDTVHLLSRFAARRREGSDPPTAAREAFAQCGGAMLHTTLVCGCSLLVYGLSAFIPTQRFAWFMFGMLTLALVSISLLLTALMCSRAGKVLARVPKGQL